MSGTCGLTHVLLLLPGLQWWQQLLAKFRFRNKFSPAKLRHIFVDERCSAAGAPGPSHKAAARIMGNSVGESTGSHTVTLHFSKHNKAAIAACAAERWAISYDKNLHQRDVEAGVRAMEEWRQALIALE